MTNILDFPSNPFVEKTYAVCNDDGRCAVVDPGFCFDAERDAFMASLGRHGLRPEAVLLTHAHVDHIYGVKFLQDRFGIPVYMHPADKPVLEWSGELARSFGMPVPDCGFAVTEVFDGQKLEIAGLEFEVIGTPGHTPGGVCWLLREDGLLFCGDTLFAGSIGRTDLKFGEYDDEIRSIMEKLMPLDPGTRIFPGHGPESTIGCEGAGNPFLEPFNEPGQCELPTESDLR